MWVACMWFRAHHHLHLHTTTLKSVGIEILDFWVDVKLKGVELQSWENINNIRALGEVRKSRGVGIFLNLELGLIVCLDCYIVCKLLLYFSGFLLLRCRDLRGCFPNWVGFYHVKIVLVYFLFLSSLSWGCVDLISL